MVDHLLSMRRAGTLHADFVRRLDQIRSFAEIVPELEDIDHETVSEDQESVASSSEASRTRSM